MKKLLEFWSVPVTKPRYWWGISARLVGATIEIRISTGTRDRNNKTSRLYNSAGLPSAPPNHFLDGVTIRIP